MITDAKRCPFCGAQPDGLDVREFFVECPSCGIQGPVGTHKGEFFAVAAWNGRAIEDKVRAEALPQGTVMHIPSGAVFDSVIAAVEPDDLIALTPQPPAPCPACEARANGEAVLVPSSELKKLQAKVAEQSERLKRLQDDVTVRLQLTEQQAERIVELESKPAARYLNTNAHLESVVAEKDALIEQCEKALSQIADLYDTNEGCKALAQYINARETLAAIAAHRGAAIAKDAP